MDIDETGNMNQQSEIEPCWQLTRSRNPRIPTPDAFDWIPDSCSAGIPFPESLTSTEIKFSEELTPSAAFLLPECR
jgi:hypothetical protein